MLSSSSSSEQQEEAPRAAIETPASESIDSDIRIKSSLPIMQSRSEYYATVDILRPAKRSKNVQHQKEGATTLSEEDKRAFVATIGAGTVYDPDVVDSIVAREMAALSVKDREQLYDDIHGVTGPVPESPELIQQSLGKLETEIAKILSSSTYSSAGAADAYNLALFMDSTYVQDDAFRLKFLRADRFDCAMAAVRLLKFFECKHELFGKEQLAKEILQDGLDEETMNVVYSGNVTQLKDRDRAGRFVSIQFLQPTEVSVRSKLKAAFYLGLKAAEKEDCQQFGTISISFLVGQEPSVFSHYHHRREWNEGIARLIEALPLRQVGIHVCHHSVAWRMLLAVFKMTSTANRIKIREHFGSYEECLQSLRTFGVPTEDFPLSENGVIDTTRHVEAMESIRREERRCRHKLYQDSQTGEQTFFANVKSPSNEDVLLGRGKTSYIHPGNTYLRKRVRELADVYEEQDTVGKQKISQSIVTEINEKMGYFLLKTFSGLDEDEGWVEVSDQVAHQKVRLPGDTN